MYICLHDYIIWNCTVANSGVCNSDSPLYYVSVNKIINNVEVPQPVMVTFLSDLSC